VGSFLRNDPVARQAVQARSQIAWALLCAFIVYGSLGTWAFYQPGIWAPTLISAPDVALNVLIYVVFGALGVLSLRDTYSGSWLRLILKCTGFAIVFSAANEALQLYTIDRVASVADIVSAAVGALAGGVAVCSARRPR
jgi:VanZ family protein